MEIIDIYKKRWNIEQGYKDLREYFEQCELEALAISMQLFLQILTNIANISDNLKTNKELHQIIAIIGAYTKKELGFM